MGDLAEPTADAQRFDVPGCDSPCLLEHDDYAELFAAESGGQHVQVVCLGADIAEQPQVTQTFVEQAEAIGTLHQAAFLGVLDSATAGADVYVVFESPDGVLLDDLYGAPGTALLPGAAAHLGAELCAALEALHAEGLTHGDLTPRSISVSQNELVRITPASLGNVVRHVPPKKFCRRLAYQAPEAIAQSAERLEASADVYAIGVLLWEAVSGRPLLRASTVDDFVSAARAGAPPNLKIDRVVPSALNIAVQRALDRNPAARPSAAELKAQLSSVAGSAGRATLSAAARKARPAASAASAQRLRAWAIPSPPVAPVPATPITPAKTEPAVEPPVAAPLPIAEASPSALAPPSLIPQKTPEEEDEETHFWRRPERTEPPVAAAPEPEPAKPTVTAAQLRDFGDDDDDDEVRLPVPVDIAAIGPRSEAPRPSAAVSKRVPAARASRKAPFRRFLLGVLVCMAVLCALLVASVALPLPDTEPTSKQERDRQKTDDPGKAPHGRRK